MKIHQTIYDIPIMTIQNNVTHLNAYKGQVMLIVNVASRCGFTQQYYQLEHWYQKFKKDGFVVLGFPCNQFANQEPEDSETISAFAESCFRVTFPLYAKVDVNGKNKAAIYSFLQKNLKQWCIWKSIPWNFTKFLINKHGEVCYRFWPITPRWWVEKRILELLNRDFRIGSSHEKNLD
jgi:glutathione peroxidase